MIMARQRGYKVCVRLPSLLEDCHRQQTCQRMKLTPASRMGVETGSQPLHNSRKPTGGVQNVVFPFRFRLFRLISLPVRI